MSARTKFEVGQRFGKLVLIDVVPKRMLDSKYNTVYKYKCRCDCGNIAFVRGYALSSGRAKGCNNSCAQRSAYDVANLTMIESDLINRLRWSAKKRKIVWELDIEIIKELLYSNCFYCGAKPANKFTFYSNGHSIHNQTIIHNGIDRLDSNLGYVTLNVVSCCTKCNYAKHTQSLDDFLLLVKSIYENLKLENLIEEKKVA